MFIILPPSGYMDPSGGDQMEVEPPPGSMGHMDSTQGYGGGGGGYGGNFEDEPPLLEELGIDFELIKQKVDCIFSQHDLYTGI